MAAKRTQSLFHLVIDSLPIRAVNCTTLLVTRIIASDKSHPLHIKTKRKLAAFDPQGFYWRFNCPVDISKKAVVRHDCKKNFTKAFVWALAEAGWAADGRPLDPVKTQERLTGAVLFSIAKDPERVLMAKKAELRSEAGNAVKRIISKYKEPASRNKSTRFERPTRNEKLKRTLPFDESTSRGTTGPKPDSSFMRFNPTGSAP